jgi:hypothetical protein
VLWLQLVGAFIAALGLFLMSRTSRRTMAGESSLDAGALP